MLKGKQIIIVSSNCLVGLGLKYMLADFFQPATVVVSPSFADYQKCHTDRQFDFIFLKSEDYVLHHNHFHPLRNRVIVFAEKDLSGNGNGSGLAWIDVETDPSDVIEQLNRIFNHRIKVQNKEAAEELTGREIEVLKLVAVGYMNKQIADTLSISTNTVITHRKNITRKLGINTVSGLTVYSLINGLITTDDLQTTNFL